LEAQEIGVAFNCELPTERAGKGKKETIVLAPSFWRPSRGRRLSRPRLPRFPNAEGHERMGHAAVGPVVQVMPARSPETCLIADAT
jgi:hypothetical protein